MSTTLQTQPADLVDFGVADEVISGLRGRLIDLKADTPAGYEQVRAGKLNPGRRSRIVAHIVDSNLAGHLFCKAMGFEAVEIAHNYWETIVADAYRFEYQVEQ